MCREICRVLGHRPRVDRPRVEPLAEENAQGGTIPRADRSDRDDHSESATAGYWSVMGTAKAPVVSMALVNAAGAPTSRFADTAMSTG